MRSIVGNNKRPVFPSIFADSIWKGTWPSIDGMSFKSELRSKQRMPEVEDGKIARCSHGGPLDSPNKFAADLAVVESYSFLGHLVGKS